jgi:hypothetical protein
MGSANCVLLPNNAPAYRRPVKIGAARFGDEPIVSMDIETAQVSGSPRFSPETLEIEDGQIN